MSLTDGGNGGNGLIMPVAPMYAGGGSGGSGFGGWGGDNGWWIILLFLFALGGWGNGFGGNGGGGGGMMPYILNSTTDSGVQRGFDQASIMTGIGNVQNGVQGLSTQLCNCCSDMQGTVSQGFNSLSTQLCNGFAGVNQGVSNGFAQAEIADNARQMANMQTAFANQSAMNQGFNQISSQFADCCCENRLASAQLQNVIQTENCADRAAISDGIRDIIVAQNAGTQRIIDQLCSDKIDAKNEKIADLERQLTMANLAASQTAQTARILSDNAAQTVALEQYLNPAPIPSYIVQNPNCCQPTNNCGCGCGSF